MKRTTKPVGGAAGGVDGACSVCENLDFPCEKCSLIDPDSTNGDKSPQKSQPGGAKNAIFGLEKDERFGTEFLIALKDIKAGTILWAEKPLVTAPLLRPRPPGPSNISNEITTCAGCYELALASQLQKCSKCDWLVCCKECEEMPDHKENECKNRIPYKFSDNLADFALIGYRVVHLKKKDPEVFRQIMSFNPCPAEDEKDQMIKVLQDYHMEEELHYFGIEDETTVEEYRDIIYTMKINTIGLSACHAERREKRFALGLYKNGCRMFHSCIPNCGAVIKLPPSHEMTVYAATDIKKGEQLTRFQREKLGDKQFGDCHQRQMTLQGNPVLNLRCICPLCVDPNEKGTNLSTLICPDCKEPTLIPPNPAAQSLKNLDDWEWKCKTRGCTVTKTRKDLEALDQEILSLSKEVPITEKQFKKCSDRWLKLCRNFEGKIHPNYWAKFSAAYELFRQYTEVFRPPLASPDWKYREEICNYLFPVLATIRPGNSADMAHIYYTLAHTWFTEIFVEMERDAEEMRMPSRSNLQSRRQKLEKIIAAIGKALKYFDLDKETPKYKELQQMKESCERNLTFLSFQGLHLG